MGWDMGWEGATPPTSMPGQELSPITNRTPLTFQLFAPNVYFVVLGCTQVPHNRDAVLRVLFSFPVSCSKLPLPRWELQSHTLTAGQAPNVTKDSTKKALTCLSFR